MARHHVFLVLGSVCIGVGLFSLITGKSLARGRGIISRKDDPDTFRSLVWTYFAIGVVCLIFYLATFPA